MDFTEKIIETLRACFPIEYVRLEDDDGITGFVVSPRFQDMSALDRQGLIEDALCNAALSLTPEERRRVLMIAGLTPAEYDTVGARIRVHKVKELAGGTIEVLLHGGLSDAEYVRAALRNQKGIETTEAKQVPGAIGVLMSFQAKGTRSNPLTKTKALSIFRKDPYLEVMPSP